MCSESDATTHMENVQNSFDFFAATKKPGLISKPGGARTTLAPLGWKIAGRFETGAFFLTMKKRRTNKKMKEN